MDARQIDTQVIVGCAGDVIDLLRHIRAETHGGQVFKAGYDDEAVAAQGVGIDNVDRYIVEYFFAR